MRGLVLAAAIGLGALGAGCTTIVDVAFDAERDFSRYRTWDWIPRGRNVRTVPGEAPALDALASRLVEQGLRERGLEREGGEVDLLVGYELQVRRQLVSVNETGANQLISSLNSSPSYLVQATTSRVDVYDLGYLQLVMTDGQREELVWRGELWARRRGHFARHLADAVVRLLDRFPAGKPPHGQVASGTVTGP